MPAAKRLGGSAGLRLSVDMTYSRVSMLMLSLLALHCAGNTAKNGDSRSESTEGDSGAVDSGSAARHSGGAGNASSAGGGAGNTLSSSGGAGGASFSGGGVGGHTRPCVAAPTAVNDAKCPPTFLRYGNGPLPPEETACSSSGLLCSRFQDTSWNYCDQPPRIVTYRCCDGAWVETYGAPCVSDAGADTDGSRDPTDAESSGDG